MGGSSGPTVCAPEAWRIAPDSSSALLLRPTSRRRPSGTNFGFPAWALTFLLPLMRASSGYAALQRVASLLTGTPDGRVFEDSRTSRISSPQTLASRSWRACTRGVIHASGARVLPANSRMQPTAARFARGGG